MPIREKVGEEEKEERRVFLRFIQTWKTFFPFFCGVSEWELWENAQKGLRKETNEMRLKLYLEKKAKFA
jgi:hypothetical protein